MIKHLDLFSGIGGFALAVDWAIEAEHIFCEIDGYCREVLKKHWPNSPIYEDIKTLKASDLGRIDLLTGGFPCQPFSVAGKQRAENDDRFLWPEMLRIIKECRPRWIVGENVAGIIELALEQVCVDLESAGYEVWPIVIPACAVNAPHRRDRVWVIGYAKHDGFDGPEDGKGGLEGGKRNEERSGEVRELERSALPRRNFADTKSNGGGSLSENRKQDKFNNLESVLSRALLPTPRAFCHKDSMTDRGKANLGEIVGSQTGWKLQPNFVEWMMGFPKDWTEIAQPKINEEPKESKPSETQ